MKLYKQAHKKPHKQRVFSEEVRRKLSECKIGENNPQWKGDKVGYGSIHDWVRDYKPKPLLCERCKQSPPRDLANISGEYLRDINDYEWLCRKCHMISDGRLENLIVNRGSNPKIYSLEEVIGIHNLRAKVSRNADRFNIGDVI